MELFLSLKGRIGRGKWWLGVVLLFIIQIILAMILGATGMMSIDPETFQPGAGYYVSLLILTLVTLWPSICISGKRYHDRNKSAWWIMIAFIPLIGAIWMLVECGFLRGTEGSNDFGQDPLG